MPNNKIYKYIYIMKNINFQKKYSILTIVLLYIPDLDNETYALH